MSKNTISFEVSEEKDTAIQTSFETLSNELGFLIELSDKENRRLCKMGRKNLDFVHRSLQHAQTSPGYIPPFVSLEEFVKDVNLASYLRKFEKNLTILTEKVRSTATLAEAEAFRAGRLYYSTAKTAAGAGDEEAETVVKDLAVHFKDLGPKKETIDSTTEETEETEQPQTIHALT